MRFIQSALALFIVAGIHGALAIPWDHLHEICKQHSLRQMNFQI